MSTKSEVENIKISGAEKVLAGVLAIFIMIGGVWAYSQIGKISEQSYQSEYGMGFYPQADIDPADRQALRAEARARQDVWQAESKVRRAKSQVTFTGDTYRTEIDAGLAGSEELAAYRKAQRKLSSAQDDLVTAQAARQAAGPAAAEARKSQRQAREKADSQQRSDDRWVAILRIALIGAMLGAGVWSLSICRRRRSRLTPLALALIVSGALMAAWMAIDYGTTLGVFREVGPLVLSLIGIALTILAFVALQRYLAKKIPARRVRKKECPFCGYPSHGNGHCEGCGRQIVGKCATCHEPRRVSTPHCGSCGAA